jgi:hypothetical protein
MSNNNQKQTFLDEETDDITDDQWYAKNFLPIVFKASSEQATKEKKSIIATGTPREMTAVDIKKAIAKEWMAYQNNATQKTKLNVEDISLRGNGNGWIIRLGAADQADELFNIPLRIGEGITFKRMGVDSENDVAAKNFLARALFLRTDKAKLLHSYSRAQSFYDTQNNNSSTDWVDHADEDFMAYMESGDSNLVSEQARASYEDLPLSKLPAHYANIPEQLKHHFRRTADHVIAALQLQRDLAVQGAVVLSARTMAGFVILFSTSNDANDYEGKKAYLELSLTTTPALRKFIPYKDLAPFCRKCSMFGHFHKQCPNKFRCCNKCGSSKHDCTETNICPNNPEETDKSCIHCCVSGHFAGAPMCYVQERMKEMMDNARTRQGQEVKPASNNAQPAARTQPTPSPAHNIPAATTSGPLNQVHSASLVRARPAAPQAQLEPRTTFEESMITLTQSIGAHNMTMSKHQETMIQIMHRQAEGHKEEQKETRRLLEEQMRQNLMTIQILAEMSSRQGKMQEMLTSLVNTSSAEKELRAQNHGHVAVPPAQPSDLHHSPMETHAQHSTASSDEDLIPSAPPASTQPLSSHSTEPAPLPRQVISGARSFLNSPELTKSAPTQSRDASLPSTPASSRTPTESWPSPTKPAANTWALLTPSKTTSLKPSLADSTPPPSPAQPGTAKPKPKTTANSRQTKLTHSSPAILAARPEDADGQNTSAEDADQSVAAIQLRQGFNVGAGRGQPTHTSDGKRHARTDHDRV